jgi:hypothetical protein
MIDDDILCKMYKVAKSCTTKEQAASAKKYIELASKQYPCILNILSHLFMITDLSVARSKKHVRL